MSAAKEYAFKSRLVGLTTNNSWVYFGHTSAPYVDLMTLYYSFPLVTYLQIKVKHVS